MGNQALRRDLNGFIHQAIALGSTTVTAGGGADDVYQSGLTIDRADMNSPESVSLAVGVLPTLASGQTATVSVKIEHSDDDSAWADYKEIAEVAVFDDGDTTVQQAVVAGVNLNGAKRYVRGSVKVEMSNTATDTAVVFAVATLDGGYAL